MKSLIPQHLQSHLNISTSRISLAESLASVITHLRVNSWPDPAKPFVQMVITFLERQHLQTLQLARNELSSAITSLQSASILPDEDKTPSP